MYHVMQLLLNHCSHSLAMICHGNQPTPSLPYRHSNHIVISFIIIDDILYIHECRSTITTCITCHNSVFLSSNINTVITIERNIYFYLH